VVKKVALSILILFCSNACAEGDFAENIMFRVTAANPSELKSQKVPIEVYLPKEIKKEDVLDTGGLEIDYDAEKKAFYLFKNDLELEPKETIFFAVKLKDVWLISQNEINAISKRATEALKQVEDTEYFLQAKELVSATHDSLAEIKRSQSDITISTAQHIEIYESNLEVLAIVKEDMVEILRLVDKSNEEIGWMGRIKKFFKEKMPQEPKDE